MDNTVWDDHKDEIKRLYIQQDKPLKEVMEILAKRRKFIRTKKQYEIAFKRWGLRKYKLRPAIWKVINRKITKRKRETGRSSEVYIDGMQYPSAKLQLGIARHGFLSAAEMYSAPSPEMPEGILVCSPVSTSVLQWPYTLPWFQFIKRVRGEDSRFAPSTLSSIVLPTDRREHPLAVYDMIPSVRTILPQGNEQRRPNVDGTAPLDQVLEVIMPEEHDGEHRNTFEVVRGYRLDVGLQERFKLLFFLLSNNFRLLEHEEDSSAHGYFRFLGIDMMRDRKREDKLILNILRSSRLYTAENMKLLFAIPGTAAKAIAEKLFGSAVRRFDIEIATSMLDAGMSAQTLIFDDECGSMTPLEYCCSEKISVDMVDLLLSHNADVNEYHHSPVLLSAVLAQNEHLIKAFVSCGADIAVCVQELKVIAEEGVDLRGKLDTLKPFLLGVPTWNQTNLEQKDVLKSILHIAVRSLHIELIEMILAHGADVDSMLDIEFERTPCQTTALGLAAEQNSTDIIQMLFMANATVNLPSTGGTRIIQPLTLAVARHAGDAMVLLVSCGGDINTSDGLGTRKRTLIGRALDGEALETFEFLFRMGATVHDSTLQSFYNRKLRVLAGNNDVDSILQLPLLRINLNGHCEAKRATGLGVAIEQGNVAIIEILCDAGATNVGTTLRKIGGVNAAKYLDSKGLLSSILCSSGQEILTAAIDANDNELVQYILPSCANQSTTTHHTREHADSKRPKRRPTRRIGERTPLVAAISQGKLQVLEALLSHGAQITDGDLVCAVGRAIRTNNDLFLRHIISLKLSLRLNAPRTIGLALRNKKPALIKLLLDAGIDPRGTTLYRDSTCVLEEAVYMDDDDIFQTILTSAEWPKETLGRCFTASIWHHNRSRAQYLHDLGADLNQGIHAGDNLWYPVQIAVQLGDISLTRTLIDYGCDPNKAKRFTDMRTPLQTASAEGNIEMVDLLLEAGADPNERPLFDGTTALQFAVKKGNLRIIQKLLNAGSDVNSAPEPYKGATALQFAAIQGYIGIVRKLLSEGADVNAGRAPKQGRTCLEGAAEHGRLDMLQFLLEQGALIEGQGRRQYIRAVKLAEWNAHSTIADYLRAHGQWTALDSRRAELETYDEKGEAEPDYDNDLAWDYGVSWDLLREVVRRPATTTTSFPSSRI